jgi:hypothetical protein
METGPPSSFLNLNIAVAMSKQNQTPIPPVGGPVEQMDLDRCMKIATGNRWLSLADGLDPAAVKAVDKCYQMLRAKAEGA